MKGLIGASAAPSLPPLWGICWEEKYRGCRSPDSDPGGIPRAGQGAQATVASSLKVLAPSSWKRGQRGDAPRITPSWGWKSFAAIVFAPPAGIRADLPTKHSR